VAGAVAGGLVGGIGGRLVMLVLRLTSDADGVISDDGFTIGEFSVFDSLQLYSAAALGGAINGVLYVAARRVLPERGRVALWGLLGASVVGGLVVHTDGVDFNLLEPLWLAIAGFVALPGLAALAVAWIVERSAGIEPWRCSPRWALLLLPAAPALVGAPLFAAGAAVVVALGRVPALRRLPEARPVRLLAVAAVLALTAAGALDLARDTAAIL
jgi:hypothetical protein